ncbi:MAG TPA: hypothetical protein VFL55_07130 [Acetobacteraceae bacterium]|nr:hypothetical protein [Acetobacteraceae bacterium]
MRPVVIGLLNATQTETVTAEELQEAAAALSVQVTQHLPQFWKTAPPAVVRAFSDRSSIPSDVWLIELVDTLANHEGGFHFTQNYLPAAQVAVATDCRHKHWTIDASHEALEMLVDPAGSMLRMGRGIKLDDNSRPCDAEHGVLYLVEICDPCEAEPFAYKIGSVLVSDFVTPEFYEHCPSPNARYSYCGNVQGPRQILPGGYITWVQPGKQQIHQMRWLDIGAGPTIASLTQTPDKNSFREFVDQNTRHHAHAARTDRQNRFPDRFKLNLGESGKRGSQKDKHKVIYYQDGLIKREVWDGGAEQPKISIEHVKAFVPIERPAYTDHRVTNLGPGLLLGGKGL